jgi:hypothetical protein
LEQDQQHEIREDDHREHQFAASASADSDATAAAIVGKRRP